MKFFELDEVYTYIPRNILIQFLNTKKENFNEKSQYLIKEYILQLIKLFDFLCLIIVNKNEESKKIYGMKYISLRNQVQKERNTQNNLIIKKMIIDRSEAEAKKLMEKWNKKTVLETRKNDLESKPKIKKRIIDGIIKEKKEKNTKMIKKSDEFAEFNAIIEEE